MRRRPIVMLLFATAASVPVGLLSYWAGNSIPVALLAAATAAGAVIQLTNVLPTTDARTTSPYVREDPVEVLRRRIRRVSGAFAEAGQLMQELQRDFAAQEAARDALIAQAEEQRQVLSLTKEEAEKIRKILAYEDKEAIRARRRREWGFFIGGLLVSAALSIPIGLWVNSMSGG